MKISEIEKNTIERKNQKCIDSDYDKRVLYTITDRQYLSYDFNLVLFNASELQYKAYHYNFDDGYDGIYEILEDENCDKSTALIFYWKNSPLFFVNNPDSTHAIHSDGKKLKEYIEKRYVNNEFKEVLQFAPLDFIKGPMYMYEELCEKEAFLHEIPDEMFLPVGMSFKTSATHSELNDHLQLNKLTTLYYFDPIKCESFKDIDGESLQHLFLMNKYYRDPEPGEWKDLVHLSNLKTLWADGHVKLKGLQDLEKFTELVDLRLNVLNEDYSILSKIKGLKRLSFSGSNDLKIINTLTQLQGLELRWLPHLENIEGIDNLKDLEYLKIEGCKKLKNIQSLFNLKKLKFLILKEIALNAKNLEGLNQLNIETLQLDCRKLKHLNFLYVKIDELMPSLKEIHLFRYDDNPELPEKINKLEEKCKIYKYTGFNDFIAN